MADAARLASCVLQAVEVHVLSRRLCKPESRTQGAYGSLVLVCFKLSLGETTGESIVRRIGCARLLWPCVPASGTKLWKEVSELLVAMASNLIVMPST